MKNIKKAFIQLALECNALQFGSFVLKSGRVSPYFFNAGLFYHSNALQELGRLYAETLLLHQLAFDHLFGPAYKGILLATSTAIALAQLGINKTVTFNRKETKNHGERGELIGAPLHHKTIIVDDVITAGTAFREAKQQIVQGGGIPAGMIIALDRCEKGMEEISIKDQIQLSGIPVISIINFFDLIDYLMEDKQANHKNQLLAYHAQYGA